MGKEIGSGNKSETGYAGCTIAVWLETLTQLQRFFKKETYTERNTQKQWPELQGMANDAATLNRHKYIVQIQRNRIEQAMT